LTFADNIQYSDFALKKWTDPLSMRLPPRDRQSNSEATQMSCQPDLIFDVGLHKGEDAAFYLKKGFRVVAFEADPELAAQCRVDFRDSIADRRLQIVEGAIAPKAAGKRITFYKNLKKSEWGTIDPKWVERNERLGTRSVKIEVDRVDLAQAFRNHGIPFYLKIDIEGADRVVLDELCLLEDRPRYISMEAAKVDFSQLEGELELLRRLGYTKFMPVQQASIPGRSISAATLQGQPLRHVFAVGSSGPFAEDLSGRWLDQDECLRAFRAIFRLYRLFGDDGVIRTLPGGLRLIGFLERLYRNPLPGWYDIHASLK
jgi:FkbM family methyltransferase